MEDKGWGSVGSARAGSNFGEKVKGDNRSSLEFSGEEGLFIDQVVFARLDVVQHAGREDTQRFVIKVALSAHEKEHVQQAYAEETTLQPSDGRRWRCVGTYSVV